MSDAAKIGGEAVEFVLAPDLEGMVMAGAQSSRTPRNSWLTIVVISSGSRRSRKNTAAPLGSAALGRDNLADELVVRLVAAKSIAQPGIEIEVRLDAHAIGIGSNQISPFVRPVIGILGASEQGINQLCPLAGRLVCKYERVSSGVGSLPMMSR